MPKNPPEDKNRKSPKPKLHLNWRMYEQFIDDPSYSDDEKRVHIETVMQLVMTFVDLGFDLAPEQQALAQFDQDKVVNAWLRVEAKMLDSRTKTKPTTPNGPEAA